jgi:hypothetical protein
MNILTTLTLAGTLAVLPGTTTLQMTSLSAFNPISGLTVSAAGIGFDLDADGIKPQAAETTDFKIELRLKSGTPIRVRL